MMSGTPRTDHVEIQKLARELDVEPHQLGFLAHLVEEELHELRSHVSKALFDRQEPRFRRLAATSKVLPTSLLAKAAQFTIGPKISAWVACVLPTDQAIKLAGALDTPFLVQVSRWLDPHRSLGIVTGLPDRTTIAIGRGLVDLGEWIPLGRYLTVVSANVIVGVMEHATDEQLLELSRFIEVPVSLDERQRATLREVFQRVGPTRADILRSALPARLLALLDSV